MGKKIELDHGAGGKVFDSLFHHLILPALNNPYLKQKTDGALLGKIEGRLVVSTDAHVVSPRFFPGGNIGHLAFCGTVNDLAVMGAIPRFLTMSMILEEGLDLDELQFILTSISTLSRQYDLPIVSGDTKVVERGHGDGIFISTAGIGEITDDRVSLHPDHIQVGDVIITTGTIGDHGAAVLSQRENIGFETELISDCAPLHLILHDVLEKVPEIHFMRDPTRGGVAAVLNEVAHQCQLTIELRESDLPVKTAVRSACELLGLEALILANEGNALIFAPQGKERIILEILKAHPLGQFARTIGAVKAVKEAIVYAITSIGGRRIVPWPSGEQLPRIC